MEEYDPEEEAWRRDHCTYRKCGALSTIIIKGEGRCDAHNFSIAGIDENYEEEVTEAPLYRSIEEYTSKTGKRFRKTKDQMDRNLSREEAFKETYG